mgnify:CR=1 FL=1
MRSFYIACVILLVIIAIIVINSFFVLNKIDKLLIICQRLEDDEFSGSLKNLTELLNEIDRAESALYLLATYYARGEQSDFLAQLETFKSALRHIAQAQKFTLENVL